MKSICTVLMVFFFFTSFAQSGITWGMPMDIAANSFGNMHPRMCMDRQGNPMVIWGKMADKSVYFSKWNGSGFTAPVKLNPAWMSIATASWMGPDIASKGDTVYVVMKRSPEASDTNYSYITRSFNAGQTFSQPVRIDNINDSMSRFPTVTTNAAGQPIVAFMKFNNAFLDSRWVVTQSSDFGSSFPPDVKASGWGASAEVCDCCPGAVLSSGNTTAMLYRDNNMNIRDIWMGVSSNGNMSYTQGCAVDNNNWMLMTCPSTGPDGFIIGDTVYSVFMNGGGGNSRNYISRTSLSNVALNTVSNITGNVVGLQGQNFPRMDHYGNAAALAWVQTVNGSVQLPLFFTTNILNGFPAQYDTVDLGNVTNTDVAVSANSVFVVWQDDASGTVKYRKGSYAGSPSSVNDLVTGADFNIAPNPTADQLVITLPGISCVLKLYSLSGQCIFSKEFNGNESEFRLNTSQFPQGMYVATLDIDGKKFSKRFMKE